MAIKIPLKMSDGTAVKTIEELREHFNLADVLGYYESERLIRWLSDGYYDEEAEKVKALDPSSEDLGKELCNILGVDYQEQDKVDLKDIANKNERLEHLKQYTDDDRILAFVDNVAFTQEELDGLVKKADTLEKDNDDNTVIYLCGEHFTIPALTGGIIYKGVNNPTVTFDGEFVVAGIDLQDLEFDIVSYVENINDTAILQTLDLEGAFTDAMRSYYKFLGAFESLILGMKLLRIAAEKGSDVAQFILGKGYEDGEFLGEGRDYDEYKEAEKEAVKWYQKAAEQGFAEAQYSLGEMYSSGVMRDDKEAVKWYEKAAEQGYMDAQKKLAYCYEKGIGVPENDKEAAKWYLKVVEQGDATPEGTRLSDLCGLHRNFSETGFRYDDVFWEDVGDQLNQLKKIEKQDSSKTRFFTNLADDLSEAWDKQRHSQREDVGDQLNQLKKIEKPSNLHNEIFRKFGI